MIGEEDRRIVFIAVFADVLIYLFQIFTNEEPYSFVRANSSHSL